MNSSSRLRKGCFKWYSNCLSWCLVSVRILKLLFKLQGSWLSMQKDLLSSSMLLDLFSFYSDLLNACICYVCTDTTNLALGSCSTSNIFVADVVEGTYDLKIPRMVAIVTCITNSSTGDWIVGLQVDWQMFFSFYLINPSVCVLLMSCAGPFRLNWWIYILQTYGYIARKEARTRCGMHCVAGTGKFSVFKELFIFCIVIHPTLFFWHRFRYLWARILYYRGI